MMKSKSLFNILIFMTLSGIIASAVVFSGNIRLWTLGFEVVTLLMLALLHRSVVKPVAAARRGLELLSAQDLNNRLAKVGEPGADKIVTLFNELITRLKNERLRLHEQDSFLRLLIEASPMGIVMLNLNNDVTVVNPAFLKFSNLEAADITGQNFHRISNDLIEMLSHINTGENKIVRYNGSLLLRCYHLSFMQEGFRRQFYLVESLTEEVRRAEKDAYEKVIRMISHEVNNTMGSVQSVLGIMADESGKDDALHEVVESCRERCESMCAFIDSFANIARIPDAVRKQVDIDSELEKMLPFLRHLAPDNISIYLNKGADPESPEKNMPKIIEADMALLQQAIINIVKNAVESFQESHAISDKFISINTISQNSGITIVIANNGSAISQDTANRLFSTFFSTKSSGRGLGLTIVSEILRRHNCTWSLRTYPDKITRFAICFPSASEH